MEIRIATPKDAEQILEIYKPFIVGTVTTFETEVPSTEEFAKRIEENLITFPWIVVELDSKIIGYAYATSHRSRCSYKWSCETSLYIAEGYRQLGVGQKLYLALFEILKRQGVINILAGVALPNLKSVSFHKKMGFDEIGTYEKVGYKLGVWVDTYWMQYRIDNMNKIPVEPIPFGELNSIEVRQLKSLPVLDELLSESMQDGYNMVERLLINWDNGSNTFSNSGEALFGAYIKNELVGICGVNIDPYQEDPYAARVRHLYVLKRHRKSGVGRRLVRVVLADADIFFKSIGLRTNSPDADTFYQKLGFNPVFDRDNQTHVLEL